MFSEDSIILQTAETILKNTPPQRNETTERLKKNERQSTIYDLDWSSDSVSVYKKRLSYLNMTGHSQQFNCTGSSWRLLGSSYSSSAKLFANVSNIGNILLIYTLWTAGFQIPLSPKNASKVIFNAREVLRCWGIAKSGVHVLLVFMFLLTL